MQPSKEAQGVYEKARLSLQREFYLTRIWNRYLSASQRQLLGPSFNAACERFRCAARMWSHVKHVEYRHAVIDVSEKLEAVTHETAEWLRREFGELPSDPVHAEVTAIERGDLVLSMNNRTFHWNGKEFNLSFTRYPALWDFFDTLCRAAKRGEGVGWDSFGENTRETYVAETKSRLRTTIDFPEDLFALIKSDGPRRQRLNLPADRIFIVE